MKKKDIVFLAYRNISNNKLRTGITVAIIGFGIMALIGIVTAIEAMKQSLKENFSAMGANSFTIRYKELHARVGHNNDDDPQLSKKGQKEIKSKLGKPFTKSECLSFQEAFPYRNNTSIYLRLGSSVESQWEKKKTNPQCTVFGIDENYLSVVGYSLMSGRNLTHKEVFQGENTCIIGFNVYTKLFNNDLSFPLDKAIKVSGIPFKVIGVLKSKGSSSFLRQDDIILTSYNVGAKFNNPGTSYTIAVAAKSITKMQHLIESSQSVFRNIRRLTPTDEDNFVIEKSDKFAQMFISFLSSITGAAGAIGFITLFGAAIGLMNIMLVAVSERTREVGLIKAIGGKNEDIKWQFLFESIIISLIGSVLGIILGVLTGNLIGLFLNTGFMIPWDWVVFGIVICSVVGLGAGIYPARKAARLDPIIALRFE